MITAGCNQAFCLAMMSLAQAGEEIVMPAPFYFNYEMWLQMLGIRLVPLSFRPEAGGEPDLGGGGARHRTEDQGHRAGLAQQPDRRGLQAGDAARVRRAGARARHRAGAGRDLSRFPADRWRAARSVPRCRLAAHADPPLQLLQGVRADRLPRRRHRRRQRASSTTRPRRWIASRSARRASGRRRRISASAISRTGGSRTRT